NQDKLFENLRTKRNNLAHLAGVAPDAVFTDSTLKEMARKKPLLMTDMEEISGMGEEKLNKYGRIFIETIKSVLNLD
ncbi:MAG: HRDC domain-containing protein, partial [Candidatus Firestonebacteria bacterium]